MKADLEKRLVILEQQAEPVGFKLIWYDDKPCHEPGAEIIQLRWLDEAKS